MTTTTTYYTTAAGESRTTCGLHRTQGYTLVGGVWLCRGCSAPQEHHEATDETVARRLNEAMASGSTVEQAIEATR